MRTTIFFLLCLIALLHILGLRDFYYSTNWYDNIVHFLGGATSALLLIQLSLFIRKQSLSFFGLLIGMIFISLTWELYEFGWDQLLVIQHGLPIQQLGVWDTVTDVVTNFIGAWVAFFIVKKRDYFSR